MHIAKSANAFYPKAFASKLALSIPHAASLLSKASNGLWVGGRVEITDDGICFAANKLNMALNENSEPVWIPMKSIHSIELEPGWMTKVVAIGHSDGEFRFRCFGAKGIAGELKKHLSTME